MKFTTIAFLSALAVVSGGQHQPQTKAQQHTPDILPAGTNTQHSPQAEPAGAKAEAQDSPGVQPVMVCNGKIVSRMIDFETQENSKHLGRDEVPNKLHAGVRVTGQRDAKSPNKPTDNDLVVLDTSRPRKEKALESDVEGNVIMINRFNVGDGQFRSNP